MEFSKFGILTLLLIQRLTLLLLYIYFTEPDTSTLKIILKSLKMSKSCIGSITQSLGQPKEMILNTL